MIMKNKKNAFFLVMSLTLIFSILPVYANEDVQKEENTFVDGYELINKGELFGSCGENVSWSLSDDGVLTLSGEGATYDYYGREKPWESYIEKIKKIVVDEGVTRIGAGCFNCFKYGILEEVELNEGLKSIGEGAFAYCQFETIIVPESVEKIEEDAFASNDKLKKIVIPGTVKNIDRRVFLNCDGLKTAGPIGGDYNIMYGWNEYIPDHAFEISEIENVVFPKELKKIGYNAFADSSVKEIEIAANVEIGKLAFNNCRNLEKVVLNKNITMEYKPFAGCNLLKTAGPIGGDYDYQYDIEDGVIPDYLFGGCYGLEEIELPNNIARIGKGAFSGTEIKEIIISAETVVKENAFEGCNALEKVVLKGNQVADNMFWNCEKLKTAGPVGGDYNIQYSWSGEKIPNKAFLGCNYLESIVLPDDYIIIGDSAFSGCMRLSDFEFSEGVTKIGRNAFEQCELLKSVIIPEGVVSIGTCAFNWCTNLEKLVIPKSVEKIELTNENTGGGLFQGSKKLLTAGPIGGDYNVEYGWTDTIPDDVFTLSYITQITFPSTITSISAGAFSGCFNLESVIIPDTVTEIGASAFSNNEESLKHVELSPNMRCIDKHMFRYCTKLEDIIIPSSIVEIQDGVFYECESLRDVYYEGTENEWKQIKISAKYNEDGKYAGNNPLNLATIHYDYRGDDSINRYIVSFNKNNGQDIINRTVRDGLCVWEIDSPNREGYVFDGWYTDSTLSYEYDFTLPVHSNFTLYAKWIEKKDSSSSSSKSSSSSSEKSSSSSSNKEGGSSSIKSSSSSSIKKDDSSSEKKDDSSSSTSGIPKPYIPSYDSENSQHIEIETKFGDKNIFGVLSVDTVKYAVFNGKKHVSQMDKTSKSAVGDVLVRVQGDITKYGTVRLKFKNNKAAWVSGRDKLESKRPYYILSFKPDKGISKEEKQQIKIVNTMLKSKPIYFDIQAVDISKEKVYIEIDKSGTKVLKASVVIDGKTYKLSKKDFTYEIVESGKAVVISGKGNYTGTVFYKFLNKE